jgi:uncharacterized CHY-type Zn-finger protein
MCKHIANAQVSVRAPCCKSWFDCTQCHDEKANHTLLRVFELVFGCKKCKKVFRKDLRDWQEQDEFCPHCDNHFNIEPETLTEAPTIGIVQSDDPELLRKQFGHVLQDERMRN